MRARLDGVLDEIGVVLRQPEVDEEAWPRVIAEQMGHADGGALVLKRYGHLYKGARRQAAIALELHVMPDLKNSPVGQELDGTQLRWDL